MQFCCVTLNVHGFRDPNKVFHNEEHLAYLLKQKIVSKYPQIDVVCLQEVRESHVDKIEVLKTALNTPHHVFGAGVSNFGNVLLSRHEIWAHSVCKATIGSHETRSMTRISLKEPFPINIYGLHLDHQFEPVRLKQLEHMFNKSQPIAQDLQQQSPHIILGDFNSLCKEDYSQPCLSAISRVRYKGNWELPQFDVYDFMVTQKGYVDTWKQRNQLVLDDKLATCAYDTRIDYIFAKHMPWKLKTSEIVDMEWVTDHHAVVSVFEQNCHEL